MKVFVTIQSNTPENPIQAAIKQVAGLAHAVVDDPADAELIITDSSRKALGFLKDDEAVQVLIALPASYQREAEESGTTSLESVYPGRVHARPMVERDGEENIVLFLLKFGQEAT